MAREKPSIREQIAVIEVQITALRLGFRDGDGAIANLGICHEIRCLEATLELLRNLQADPPPG
jgi:hypothetical protein